MADRLPDRLSAAAAFVLLVLPWIHPWSFGPSRSVTSWLIAMACLAGAILLRRAVSPRLFAQALLVAALLNAAMAVLQYLGLSSALAPWVWPVGPGEGFGNLRQRNHFGSLTALGLAALLAWQATRVRGQPPALAPGLAGAVLLLLAAGNAASQSRTGLLAWVGVALAGVWFCHRQGRQGLVLAVAAAVVPLLAALACQGTACGAIGRLAHSGQDSRLLLWRDVLALIGERPWSGWGWGELGYAHFISELPAPRFPEKLSHAHNLPLHLAVELGLPVALAVCAAVALVLWRARPWRETHPWRWGAWLGLGVLGLHSLLEYPLWYGPFQMVVLWSLGWLWLGRPAAPGPRRSVPLDVAAAGLLALVLSLGLDYLRVSQPYLPPAQRSTWLGGPALAQAQRSWVFRAEADFAALALTPLSEANAPAIHALAKSLLHHSAEPLVIDKLLDSARLLGRSDEVDFYARRYQAAYPEAHAAWLARQGAPAQPPAR